MKITASLTSALVCGRISPSSTCCEKAALSPISSTSPKCGHRLELKDFKVPARLSARNEGYPGNGIARSPKQSPRVTTAGAYNTSDRNMNASFFPFQPQSTAGKVSIEMLQSHAELLSTTADQQLELLAADRHIACAQQQLGSESILYRRIAEMKFEERRRLVQEIMHALVVKRFMEEGVTMYATPPVCSRALENQYRKLEAVHPPQVQEMVKKHVLMVIRGKNASSPHFDPNAVTQISRLRMGQIYAASVMYGYFLRRAFDRFRLELSLKTRGHVPGDDPIVKAAAAGQALEVTEAEKGHFYRVGDGDERRRSEFERYIMSFDEETLQRNARLRTEESVEVIERHAEALFGKAEMESGEEDGIKETAPLLRVSLAGVQGLVWEALAFGTFLWDVETHVDSHYPLPFHKTSS